MVEAEAVIGEEGEDGSKVVGREEDMAGVVAEVGREVGEGWKEVVGELQTEDGGEVAWKEGGGVHRVTWAGEGEPEAEGRGRHPRGLWCRGCCQARQ